MKRLVPRCLQGTHESECCLSFLRNRAPSPGIGVGFSSNRDLAVPTLVKAFLHKILVTFSEFPSKGVLVAHLCGGGGCAAAERQAGPDHVNCCSVVWEGDELFSVGDGSAGEQQIGSRKC